MVLRKRRNQTSEPRTSAFRTNRSALLTTRSFLSEACACVHRAGLAGLHAEHTKIMIVALFATLKQKTKLQVPLSDETVAIRVAELVDGVVKQLLAVWDKLEPAALGGDVDGAGLGSEIGMMAAAAGSLSVAPLSTQLLSSDANSGEIGR